MLILRPSEGYLVTIEDRLHKRKTVCPSFGVKSERALRYIQGPLARRQGVTSNTTPFPKAPSISAVPYRLPFASISKPPTELSPLCASKICRTRYFQAPFFCGESR